jgi:integrase
MLIDTANSIGQRFLTDNDSPTVSPSKGTKATKDQSPMLHEMIDRYLDWFCGKADRSDSGKRRIRQTLGGAKAAYPDIAVKDIDRLWIDNACQHWKNRPANKTDGKPIAPFTVKAHLQHLSQFFGWMSDNEEVTGFIEPKRMAKLFKYRPAAVEIDEPMTLDEIKALYSAGTDQQKLYLLLGVMCGQTQLELSFTTKGEFNFEASTWNHKRHKTGVMGSHWLCPELLKLLKDRIKTTPKNKDNLAFLTEDKMPLVFFSAAGNNCDSVRLAWNQLQTKAELKRCISYKMCRKFLGQWVRDHHGEELAQVALQHKSNSVISKHYAKHRNFEPLHEAQKELYSELTGAGVFKG